MLIMKTKRGICNICVRYELPPFFSTYTITSYTCPCYGLLVRRIIIRSQSLVFQRSRNFIAVGIRFLFFWVCCFPHRLLTQDYPFRKINERQTFGLRGPLHSGQHRRFLTIFQWMIVMQSFTDRRLILQMTFSIRYLKIITHNVVFYEFRSFAQWA